MTTADHNVDRIDTARAAIRSDDSAGLAACPLLQIYHGPYPMADHLTPPRYDPVELAQLRMQAWLCTP